MSKQKESSRSGGGIEQVKNKSPKSPKTISKEEE